MKKPLRQLKPLTDNWEWQQHGLCRDADSSVFFHPQGERGAARARRTKKAKAICGRCPVIKKCREHALAVGEPYGIWGGMSERELIAALDARAHRSSADSAVVEGRDAA